RPGRTGSPTRNGVTASSSDMGDEPSPLCPHTFTAYALEAKWQGECHGFSVTCFRRIAQLAPRSTCAAVATHTRDGVAAPRRARTARIGATASWRWTVFQANISGKFEGGVGGEGPDHGFQRKGANRMSGTVTLFRIRGIPVRVHLSWLVVF